MATSSQRSFFTIVNGSFCYIKTKNEFTFIITVCDRTNVWTSSFRNSHLCPTVDVSSNHLAILFNSFVETFQDAQDDRVRLYKDTAQNASSSTAVPVDEADGNTQRSNLGSDVILEVSFLHNNVERTVVFPLPHVHSSERDGHVWKLLLELYRVTRSRETATPRHPNIKRFKSDARITMMRNALRPRLHLGSTVRRSIETGASSNTVASADGGNTSYGGNRDDHAQRGNVKGSASSVPGTAMQPWKPVNTAKPNLVARTLHTLRSGALLPDPTSGSSSDSTFVALLPVGGDAQKSPHKNAVKLEPSAQTTWASALTDTRQVLQRQLLNTQLELIRLQNELAGLTTTSDTNGDGTRFTSDT